MLFACFYFSPSAMINYTFQCDLSILDGINVQLKSDSLQIPLLASLLNQTQNNFLLCKLFSICSPQPEASDVRQKLFSAFGAIFYSAAN
jgi:hypothetical protein